MLLRKCRFILSKILCQPFGCRGLLLLQNLLVMENSYEEIIGNKNRFMKHLILLSKIDIFREREIDCSSKKRECGRQRTNETHKKAVINWDMFASTIYIVVELQMKRKWRKQQTKHDVSLLGHIMLWVPLQFITAIEQVTLIVNESIAFGVSCIGIWYVCVCVSVWKGHRLIHARFFNYTWKWFIYLFL